MGLSSLYNLPRSQRIAPDGLAPSYTPPASPRPASTRAHRGISYCVVQTLIPSSTSVPNESTSSLAGLHTNDEETLESIGGLGSKPSSRGRTPGIRAGSGHVASSTAQKPSAPLITTHPRATPCCAPSSTQECVVDRRGSRPAISTMFTAFRGPASNPFQTEPPPRQIIAQGSFTGSLHPDPTTCFVLVIAVSVDNLRDPYIDLDFIRDAFKSPKVHIVSLFNEEATHEAIERELGSLYQQACKGADPSRIFAYLTGMGDRSGNMCLSADISVGPQDLKGWLGKLRPESTRPRIPIGVVFDVCRRGAAPSDPDPGSNLDSGLALVRTCMLGQWAYALYFGPGLPSSLFLVSLFLAAHDVLVGSESFEDAFKSRMAQQGRMLWFIHYRRHKDKKCDECPNDHKCAQPGLQECEWEEAGHDTFLSLGELIIATFPDVAHWVEEKVTAKMSACGFLEWDLNSGVAQTAALSDPAVEVSTHPMPSVPGAVRARGRSQAVSQATAPSTVV